MKTIEWKKLIGWVLGELRTLALRNWQTKLLSIGFAFAIWLWVNAGEREVQVIYFPLEYAGQPKDSVLVGNRVDRVAVHLNGPRTLLAPIETNRRPIVVDLSSVKPTQPTRLKIRDWMVRVPRGVRVMQVEPSKIPVTLEAVRRVAVPVEARLRGEVALGYRVDDAALRVTPAKVLVSGPESVLKNVRRVETEAIDVTGLDKPFRGKVAVLAENLTEVQPPLVSVEVAVVPVLQTRIFKQVEVTAKGSSGDSYVIEPKHVEVKVRGPVRELAELELGQGSVFVRAGDASGGPHRARVRVKLPPGLELAEVTPRQVTIRSASEATGTGAAAGSGGEGRENGQKRKAK